jgi:hypothetical protein
MNLKLELTEHMQMGWRKKIITGEQVMKILDNYDAMRITGMATREDRLELADTLFKDLFKPKKKCWWCSK